MKHLEEEGNNTMITPKQIPYFVLDHREVDVLIQTQFNRPDYDCVVEEEWSNDSEHSLVVDLSAAGGYDDDEREDVERFVNGSGTCKLVWLLHALAEKQVIPQGNYLIDVCW